MPAAVLTPRVRILAICDGVRESKAEAGVFHLKGVRQAIVAHAFQFSPARLWLFLLLSSSRAGDFPCYIRVVKERGDRVFYQAHLEPRPRFRAEGGLWAGRYSIGCRFPEQGNYSVQVWFFQERGSDVLKGEIPFAITTEGHAS